MYRCVRSDHSCEGLEGILWTDDILPESICEDTRRKVCEEMGNLDVIPVTISNQGELHMGIRQWVEEPPDHKLGHVLVGLPAWKAAMHDVRQFIGVLGPGQGILYRNTTYARSTEEVIVNILQRHALPWTPGVARFALWLALKEAGFQLTECWPSRGMLLTSVVYRYPETLDANGRASAKIIQYTVAASLATTELLTRLHKTMRSHWQCLVSLPGLLFPDLDLRHWNGRDRFQDATARDVADYLAGRIDRKTAHTNAINRAKAESGFALDPLQQRAMRKRVNSRIYRAKIESP